MTNHRVLEVYERVMDLPEGPPSKEYQKMEKIRRKGMSPGELEAEEEEAREVFQTNMDILLELGFAESEAQFLARCRLNSPGIRKLITERVRVTRFAQPHEVKWINEGAGDVLRLLIRLYGGETCP